MSDRFTNQQSPQTRQSLDRQHGNTGADPLTQSARAYSNVQLSLDSPKRRIEEAAKALPSWSKYHRRRWSDDSWGWEILSCGLSISAVITVAIVLFIYNDEAIPKLPYDIGLNTVVAILGTISKTSLLLTIASSISQFKWLNFTKSSGERTLQELQIYDEASRGPWGSFILLFKPEGLSWGKVGALITVFKLIFDPAYQALMRIEQRSIYQDKPIAMVHGAKSMVYPSKLFEIDSDNGDFTYDWRLVITNAVFDNKMSTEGNPSCPTGNCTFPTFSSLGFCSNCVSVTRFVQESSDCKYKDASHSMSCTYRFPPSNFSTSYKTDLSDVQMVNNSFNTKFEMNLDKLAILKAPSFLAFALYVDVDSESTDGLPEQEFKTFQAAFDMRDGESIPSNFGPFALVKITTLAGDQDNAFVEAATICALSFCAREYNVTVINGVLHSEIMSTSYSKLTYGKSNYLSNASLPFLSSSYNFTFPNSTNNFDFVPEPIRYGGQNSTNIDSLESALQYALEETLTGNSTFSYESSQWVEIGETTSATSFIQEGLNASTDIPATMNNVALAMTNHLREMSDLITYGQSITTEVFVHVSWLWLILPISSVISGTLLLFFAIRNTRRNRLHVWKSSELALLFHAQDMPLENLNGVYKTSEMEAIAGQIQVKLGQGGQMRFSLKSLE